MITSHSKVVSDIDAVEACIRFVDDDDDDDEYVQNQFRSVLSRRHERALRDLTRLTRCRLRGGVPDGEPGESGSLDEQLVVMEHSGLVVELLHHQLAVGRRPVEHVGWLVVRDGSRLCQVAARRVITHDERVRAIQRRRHHHTTLRRRRYVEEISFSQKR